MRTIILTDRELHTACEQEQGLLLRLAPGRVSGNATTSPYGKVGEHLRVQERLWISDCGKYYAQDARRSNSEWWHDVITTDGSKRYFGSRYTPTGWEDTDPRYRYPEFPHLVNSWSNLGHTLRSGRYIEAFRLGFGDYDTSTAIQSLKGNTERASYDATFHRRIPGHLMPEWAERLQIELTGITLLHFEEVLISLEPAWKEMYWTFQEHYGNATIEKNPLVWQLAYKRVALKDHAEGKCPHDLRPNVEEEEEEAGLPVPGNLKQK